MVKRPRTPDLFDFERTQEAYNRRMETFAKLVGVKPVHVAAKEVQVRAGMFKRNFTKRQLAILQIIKSFSYSFGKETALFPKTGDFTICGIGANKIRGELDKLKEYQVIDWDETNTRYWVQDPTVWTAPFNREYSDRRALEITKMNLRDVGLDPEKFMAEMYGIME